MRSSVIFVFLEFFGGLAFAILAVFIFSKYDESSLNTSIFYSFLISFISMVAGIGLVGYFHLRVNRSLNKYGKAMALSFVWLFLFLLLYFIVDSFLPNSLGFLSIILPLTGGVVGFNQAVSKKNIA